MSLTVKGVPSARYRKGLRGSPVPPLVYFVRAERLGLIKIGLTMDIGDRLKTLQVGSPDKLTLVGAMRDPDAERIESRLHARFRADRSHGEWFHPSAALLDLISEWPVERMQREARADLRAAMTRAHAAPAAS